MCISQPAAEAASVALSAGLYAQLRNGVQVGPLKKSPMWDSMFFDQTGYHWSPQGTLIGFQPGGNLDIVKTAANPEDLRP